MNNQKVTLVLAVLVFGMVALLSVGWAFGWKMGKRTLNREMVEGPGATQELLDACDRLGLEECEVERSTYRSQLEECEWRLKQNRGRCQSCYRQVVTQIESINFLDDEWEACSAVCPDYSDHVCRCCKWEGKWGLNCWMLKEECDAYYERMEEP